MTVEIFNDIRSTRTDFQVVGCLGQSNPIQQEVFIKRRAVVFTGAVGGVAVQGGGAR